MKIYFSKDYLIKEMVKNRRICPMCNKETISDNHWHPGISYLSKWGWKNSLSVLSEYIIILQKIDEILEKELGNDFNSRWIAFHRKCLRPLARQFKSQYNSTRYTISYFPSPFRDEVIKEIVKRNKWDIYFR